MAGIIAVAIISTVLSVAVSTACIIKIMSAAQNAIEKVWMEEIESEFKVSVQAYQGLEELVNAIRNRLE